MGRKAPNMAPVGGYKRPVKLPPEPPKPPGTKYVSDHGEPPPVPPKPPEARCFMNGKRIYPPYAPSPRDRIIPQDTCSKIEVKESSLWCLVILGFLLGSMTTLIICPIFVQR